MSGLLLALALLVAPGQAGTADGDVVAELAATQLDEPPLEDPPDEATASARTARLTKSLRCPVCQGLSVADSPSDAARAMGGRIGELVKMGYTEDQISAYFVDRYGPWVELEPPAEGWNRVLFLGPLGVGLLGLLLVGFRLRNRQERETAPEVGYEPDPTLAVYRAQILAELAGDK